MTARALLLLAALIVFSPATGAADEGCPDCLRAGAATAALRVPAGAPLAGYGAFARRLLLPDVLGRHAHTFWFRPAEGDRDPLAVRAVVLETATTRVVWVTVDLIAVDRDFMTALRRRLERAGIRAGTLIVSASHTHSGPGAFFDSVLMAAIAVDRQDPTVTGALLDSVVDVVQRADAGRAPARLASTAVMAPALTRPRLATAPDRQIVVLKLVTDAGAPIAVVWNYAIHGTMLGPRNLHFSGDVMGEASRRIERDLGVPALFVNGAVGDVSPRRHGPEAVLEAGGVLASTVHDAWTRAGRAHSTALAAGSVRVALPAPALSLRNCIGRWVPRSLRLPVAGAFPEDAELTAVGAGDTAWVTIPGELQSQLGEEIKHAARPRWPRAFVAGLSNDYLGYFVRAEDYDTVSYVSCASIYGREAGATLATAAAGLLRALGVP